MSIESSHAGSRAPRSAAILAAAMLSACASSTPDMNRGSDSTAAERQAEVDTEMREAGAVARVRDIADEVLAQCDRLMRHPHATSIRPGASVSFGRLNAHDPLRRPGTTALGGFDLEGRDGVETCVIAKGSFRRVPDGVIVSYRRGTEENLYLELAGIGEELIPEGAVPNPEGETEPNDGTRLVFVDGGEGATYSLSERPDGSGSVTTRERETDEVKGHIPLTPRASSGIVPELTERIRILLAVQKLSRAGKSGTRGR